MEFKIEQVMNDKGFTNAKLAKAIGVTRSTITNNLENPTLKFLERIAHAMDVKVSDLLDEGSENDMQEIFTKDENGELHSIGFIRK